MSIANRSLSGLKQRRGLYDFICTTYIVLFIKIHFVLLNASFQVNEKVKPSTQFYCNVILTDRKLCLIKAAPYERQ